MKSVSKAIGSAKKAVPSLATVSTAAVSVKKASIRTACGETPLEKWLREATSNKSWGCPNSLLYDIARASGDPVNCQIILQKVWSRLQAPEEKWNATLKTLTMLEFLLWHASEGLVREVSKEQQRLQPLMDVVYSHSGKGKDETIRARATRIVVLLTDQQMLRHERSKALAHRHKLSGAAIVSTRGDVDQYDGLGNTRHCPHIENPVLEDLRRHREKELEKRRTALERQMAQQPRDASDRHGIDGGEREETHANIGGRELEEDSTGLGSRNFLGLDRVDVRRTDKAASAPQEDLLDLYGDEHEVWQACPVLPPAEAWGAFESAPLAVHDASADCAPAAAPASAAPLDDLFGDVESSAPVAFAAPKLSSEEPSAWTTLGA